MRLPPRLKRAPLRVNMLDILQYVYMAQRPVTICTLPRPFYHTGRRFRSPPGSFVALTLTIWRSCCFPCWTFRSFGHSLMPFSGTAPLPTHELSKPLLQSNMLGCVTARVGVCPLLPLQPDRVSYFFRTGSEQVGENGPPPQGPRSEGGGRIQSREGVSQQVVTVALDMTSQPVLDLHRLPQRSGGMFWYIALPW